jgi:hypothetical protein
VFQIWKFRPSVSFLVATILVKDMHEIRTSHFQTWHCPPYGISTFFLCLTLLSRFSCQKQTVV